MAGFDYSCDWKSGFVMDPTRKQSVGYITKFVGCGMESDSRLAADIQVFSPWSVEGSEAEYTELEMEDVDGTQKITCTGVLEHFSWGGGVGDPICVSAYISAENANIMTAKLKSTLTTTKMSEFAYWIIDFDEENKVWFEKAFPKEPAVLTGQINALGKNDVKIHMAEQATKISANIDLNVYNLYAEIIPAANTTYQLAFASSQTQKFIKNWGLVVGTNAATAMGG